MKTTSILTVERPMGLDQSWEARAPYASVAKNLRYDTRGAWREAGGLLPVVTVTGDAGPIAGLSIETIHWWSQHNGARRWLMFEYTATGMNTATLAYYEPSNLGFSYAIVETGRTAIDGPWTRTQYAANAGWLYYINGHDEPTRWDGDKRVRIGFQSPPEPPLVSDQNVDFNQEDRTGRAIGLWDDAGERELDVADKDAEQAATVPFNTEGQFTCSNQQRGVGSGHSRTQPSPLWRYGYAITYVNDLGQESELSRVVFVTGENEPRRNKRQVAIQIPEAPFNVSAVRLYRTTNLRASSSSKWSSSTEVEGVTSLGYTMSYQDYLTAGMRVAGTTRFRTDNEFVNTVNNLDFEMFLLETFETGAPILYVDDSADTELRMLFNPYNVGAFPKGAKLLKMYKGTMFVAGMADYPDRVYYSAPLYIEQFPSRNFLQLGDRDSGEITGLFADDNTLIVFKQRGIYLVKGDPSSGFYSVTLTEEIGSSSPNALVATPVGTVFVSENGIYLLKGINDASGKPTVERISDPIQKLWEEDVFTQNLLSAQGCVNYPDDEIWIHVPARGRYRPALGLVYHYNLKTWTVRGTMVGDGSTTIFNEGNYPINCFAASHDEYQNLYVGSWFSLLAYDGVHVYSHATQYISSPPGTKPTVNPAYTTCALGFGTKYERTMVLHFQPTMMDYGDELLLVGKWRTQRDESSQTLERSAGYADSELPALVWSQGTWGTTIWGEYRPTILRLDTTVNGSPLMAFESEYGLHVEATPTGTWEGRFALLTYDVEVCPSRAPTTIKKLGVVKP